MGLEDEILTPSELRYVMDDIKNFPTNFVESSVPVQQLLTDQLEMSGSSHQYDSDQSDQRLNSKRKRPKRICDSTLSAPTSLETLPCLEPYPGPFNFQLQLPVDNSTHRWTYSKVLKKVFIDIDKVLALQFKWNYADVKTETEMFVRAMPVFTAHDSLKVPVERCPIHVIHTNPLNLDFRFIEHVMRCEHGSTSYEKDPISQRLSCRTPLSRPQPGSETTTLTYKFVCKTSCLSGMNRKPISVIFTLEDANFCEYGRQQLAVKICSCPKRDKAKEEKNESDRTKSVSRIVPVMDFNPNMVCVRNGSTGSSFHGEPLRDIKNVARTGEFDHRIASSTATADTCHSKPHDRSLKSTGKVRKDRDEETTLKEMLKDLREMINSQDRIIKEFTQKRDQIESGSFRKFGRYVEAQLNELPPESAIELQSELHRLICEKRLQVLKWNNEASVAAKAIDGLNPFVYRALLTKLYDAFVGMTVRCNLTDTDSIIHQLQIQLDSMDGY